jgi:protocatechuate 4,5-dioxygenase alpha chain
MSRNWAQAIPTQEAYWIDRVLYDTQHDPAEMSRFRADPEAYCAGMPLTATARGWIVANDIGALYTAGTNPYLLRAHCLQLGVSEADYLGALRAVGEEAADG